MALLSVHDCGDSILIADEEKAIGRLPKKSLHPIGLEAFLKTNYNLQGSVNYQSWLSGVLAGAVLIFGPPALPSEDQTAAVPDPELLPGEIIVPGQTVIDGKVVQSVDGLQASNIEIDELTGDGSGEAAKLATDGGFVISTKNLPEDPGGILAISPENYGSLTAEPPAALVTGGGESAVLSSDGIVPAAKADEIAPAPEASGSGSP